MRVPEPVAVGASLLACDPSGLTSASRDLAVQAHRELGGHERAAGQAVLDVELVQPPSPLFEHANRRLDAGSLQHPQAGSPHALVGIGHRHDDAR